MKMKIVLVAGLMMVISMACQHKAKEVLPPNMHKVVVSQVLQATNYTYIEVKEDGEKRWLAVSKMPVAEGATLYYEDGMEMNNFASKDLNRTFETVYFIQKISDKPIEEEQQTPANMGSVQPSKPVIKRMDAEVDKAEDGITIAELYANKDAYAGKTVKIRGQVTKYNAGILGKNWAHIQDGTEVDNNFDLTVTTQDEVKPADVVTFEGTINLNKDFGAGYSYDVIMEDAKKVDK